MKRLFPISTALFALVSPSLGGVVFTDSFSVDGAPGAHWVTDTDGDSTLNATVNVSGGALNVNTGSVSGLTAARHSLLLTGTGAPTLTLASNWTVEAVVTIAEDTAFATMAGGEGVQVTLDVRNQLPDTDDRAQINFVNLNFGSETGPDHAVRGAHQIDGVEVASITNLGSSTSALTATMRMAYDATASEISFGLDAGDGFIPLVAPVDTSAWSMTTADPLLLRFELGLAKFSPSDVGANSTFSIEDGEASVESFTIYDETLATNTVPEPSTWLLSLSALAVAFRRRR